MDALHAMFRHTTIYAGRRPLKMALLAYFDESGKFHDPTGYICLCGYLADHLGWQAYNDTWNCLLQKHRMRGIHMTQFDSECRRRGWSQEQADKVLLEFISCIRANVLVGFSIGVDGKYFRHKLEIAGKPNQDPALFAVRELLRKLRTYCDECAALPGVPPRIALTFDEDEEYSLKVYRVISQLRRRYPRVKEMVTAISFADDEVYSPLQAADILATLTGRYWRERIETGHSEPTEVLRSLTAPSELGYGAIFDSKLWNVAEIDRELPQIIKLLEGKHE